MTARLVAMAAALVPLASSAAHADDWFALPQQWAAADADFSRQAAEPEPASRPAPDIGQILKEDLQRWPGELWTDLRLAYGSPRSLLALGIAGAATWAIREYADDPAANHWKDDGGQLGVGVNIGDVLGHPGTHLAAAAGLYFAGAASADPRLLGFARRMIDTLVLTDLSTLAVKGIAGSDRPNGQRWGFPSGHAASSFAVATLVDDEFGHGWGTMAYALAGFVGWSRIDGGKHDVSDVFFGAAMGIVIARGICEGRSRQAAGEWAVVPYVAPDMAGVAFVKAF
jgi:membrane-associated phospholipid phosphatase